jgi:hypothetical protein
VVAHRNDIQSCPDCRFHNGGRMHVQLGAWRKASVDMSVDRKHFQAVLLP